MKEVAPRILGLCDEFGISVVSGRRQPAIGETRAAETMNRIWHRYGEDHTRRVMRTLVETANNKAVLDEVGLWMASDMLRVCGFRFDENASAWLELWDAIDLPTLRKVCRDLSGVVPQRHALGGMVYERIYRVTGPNAAQPDLFDDRRQLP